MSSISTRFLLDNPLLMPLLLAVSRDGAIYLTIREHANHICRYLTVEQATCLLTPTNDGCLTIIGYVVRLLATVSNHVPSDPSVQPVFFALGRR